MPPMPPRQAWAAADARQVGRVGRLLSALLARTHQVVQVVAEPKAVEGVARQEVDAQSVAAIPSRASAN